MLNKSFITNLVSLLFILAGYFSPIYNEQLMSVGLFALSGAVTNWLAIHMLFEKVPGLYGSGVMPARFEEFNAAIKTLMMGQFFSKENIDNFFHSQSDSKGHEGSIASQVDFTPMINSIDYDQIFSNLLEVVTTSPLGGMLSMFGGANALEPLKEPFTDKMKVTILEVTKSDKFLDALEKNMLPGNISEGIVEKIEALVDKRLSELTPQMVKEMVQDMIAKHLGWLVVWGGIFGGIIGLAASFL